MEMCTSASNSSKTIVILKNYIDGFIGKKKYRCLKVVKEFKDIISKLQQCRYTAFVEFSTDIDVLVRNAGGVKTDKGKAAKELKVDWHKELKEIQRCIDCYYVYTTSEDGDDYFTLVCSQPHLLVYVQESECDGSRWWPAKVISVDGNSKVTIQCFGDHLRSAYKFVDCILYSDTEDDLRKKAEEARNAMKSKKLAMKKEYKCAFEEVEKYIDNIKQKYGERSFIPAAKGRKITDVDKHLKEMYPAAYANELRPKIEPQATLVDTQRNDSDGALSGTMSPVSFSNSLVSRNDDIDEFFGNFSGLTQPGRSGSNQTPNETQTIQLRIDQIKQEYFQHGTDGDDDDDELNIEPQVENDISATNERTFEESTVETGNVRTDIQKRRADIDPVVMKQPKAKRIRTAPSVGATCANDDVITIDDEDETERPSTSFQNQCEQNSAGNDGKLSTMLDEYAEIIRKMTKNEEEAKKVKAEAAKLRAQESIIKTKIENYKK